MTTPGKLCNYAALLLDARAPSKNDRWNLILRNREFLCIPREDAMIDDILIKKITREQITEGFLSSEWMFIGERMFNLCKELDLCPQIPKP